MKEIRIAKVEVERCDLCLYFEHIDYGFGGCEKDYCNLNKREIYGELDENCFPK